MRYLPGILLILSACPSPDDDPILEDADGDGYSAVEDCNDDDSTVHPGADERCNEIDDNCDGEIDNDPTDGTTFFEDADSDGYGAPGTDLSACVEPEGYSDNADDCDDQDTAINPVATEVCDADDVDENCNGVSDDADATVDSSTYGDFWTDGDGDGYGAGDAILPACDAPEGYADNALDCDDGDPAVWDACPPYDGYWLATDLSMTVSASGRTIECAGTIDMTVAEPSVTGGTMACDAGADLGTLSGVVSGTFDGADRVVGQILADGQPIAWTGVFASETELRGTISQDIEVDGLFFEIRGKFAAAPMGE